MNRDGPLSTVRLKTGRHCSANLADPIRWLRKRPPRKTALSPNATSTAKVPAVPSSVSPSRKRLWNSVLSP